MELPPLVKLPPQQLLRWLGPRRGLVPADPATRGAIYTEVDQIDQARIQEQEQQLEKQLQLKEAQDDQVQRLGDAACIASIELDEWQNVVDNLTNHILSHCANLRRCLSR